MAVSLVKGLDFDDEGPVLITDMIREGLGEDVSEVCVLMGANVADEMARDEFCEATLGCPDPEGAGAVVQQLFDCPTFRVEVTPDPIGVELCGALKNVVALAAGFCDGLDWGGNTKVGLGGKCVGWAIKTLLASPLTADNWDGLRGRALLWIVRSTFPKVTDLGLLPLPIRCAHRQPSSGGAWRKCGYSANCCIPAYGT
jgi:hypothetical protein